MTKALFITSMLNRAMHNNAAFRTGSELCPGTRASGWRTGDFAKHGHVEMLRVRLARLQSESESISEEECNSNDANEAADNGHLEVVRELRTHGIECRSWGAVRAAATVIWKCCAICSRTGSVATRGGADFAAMNGRLEMVQYLLERGVHCSVQCADWTAGYGRLEVVRDLLEHAICCAS